MIMSVQPLPLPHTGTVLAVVSPHSEGAQDCHEDNSTSTDIGTVPAAYKQINLATNDSDKNVINIIIHKYYYIISVL